MVTMGMVVKGVYKLISMGSTLIWLPWGDGVHTGCHDVPKLVATGKLVQTGRHGNYVHRGCHDVYNTYQLVVMERAN